MDVVAIRQFGSEEWEVLKDRSGIDAIIESIGETRIHDWILGQMSDPEPIYDDY